MLDRRRLLQSAALGAGLAAVGGAAFARPEGGSADDALKAFMDKAFEETLDRSPEVVTMFGLDKGPRAGAKSRLTVPTRAEEEAQRAFVLRQAADLGRIDRGALSPRDLNYYDSIKDNLDGVIATYAIPYGQGGWPNPYRVSQQGGAYQSTPDFLANQHTIETAADADAYVARVDAFADVLAAETDRLKEDYALGVVPPDFILAKAIRQQEGFLATPAATSPLTQSVVERTQAKGLTGDWGAQVQRLIETRVYPALAAQAAVLKAAQPNATHEASVRRLPQGEQYYANSLRYITTTQLTADEIHRTGVEQMAELTARADGLLKAQGLTQGSVAERIKAMGDDPKYVYPNTDAGKAELIAKLNAQMADMQGRLPDAFGRLPKAKVEIKRVPPEIEAGAPMGYYNSPSLDGTRPGIYWINLKDTAEWPSWSLPTLTYHEATPGHHLQISLQQESESAPLLMNLLGFSSYVEGWGLYAEQLADELGAYENDPAGQIGYLQSLMFRAARLVVDTGIHAKGWSREQGIRYMMEAYGDQEGAATSEVERYCGWPGQACAYKVGHNEWVRLREQAKTTLGPRFDIKGFHDTALAAGGVPLSVLDRIVAAWVQAQA
ncbi:MAG: DUF885 domain-containing protein [Brevundimonas sp.]|uniref:DUF885 domain-containing protein n=1 Tax=Brevundimonas sp. TaxID=1871086 RepID=UPI000DB29484|nr:DUF885 family protein [Brevundimonas sp.]PZU01244.1 MAG: DUF885 domain-containing protein [Brevundimonas sp.]